MPEDMPIDAKILSGAIESAQKRIEDNNFRRRKYVLAYDDVMNQQRTIIYGQRQDVLNGEDVSEMIKKMICSSIEGVVETYLHGDEVEDWDLDGLRAHYLGLLTSEEDFRYDAETVLKSSMREEICEQLCGTALERYLEKEELFGAEAFREVERAILLQTVDRHWMEHIDVMDDLKGGISLQAYAQRDPVNEYRLQGSELFEEMVAEIRSETVRILLSAVPRTQNVQRVQIAKPLKEGLAGESEQEKKKTVIVRKAEKVGRNDLCPCGSGKKYKKCCGAAGGSNE